MIRCHLNIIMAQRGIRFISELARETGLSKTTLQLLYTGKTSGIQFKTIETLCAYLRVGIGELFEFKAD